MWKTLAFSCLILGASGAIAAGAADVIAARQANFKQIGKANKGIMDELKNPAPSVPVLQANAKTLATLAPQVVRWFPAGSGPESGATTKALPAIWQQNAKFKEAAANFATATRNLNAAAASGDIARIRAAYGAVGGTCKGCHETFRGR
jgi:cytochrome c556